MSLTGKTFTILGEPGFEGIISRSIRKLFDARKSIGELSRFEGNIEIAVELLEVYNEKVRDLLVSTNTHGQESLKIKANEAIGSTIVQVNSQEEVEKILKTAQSRRCVKATSSNAVSSRSHMLFTLYFKVHSKDGSCRVGKLNICDLAGSERLGKSQANDNVGVSCFCNFARLSDCQLPHRISFVSPCRGNSFKRQSTSTLRSVSYPTLLRSYKLVK